MHSLQPTTDHAPRRIEVAGKQLRAEHPLVLPAHVCVRCGSREPGGTVRNETVTYVSPWIWLTMFISWFITWIAYLVTRKRIGVQYYLCPACSDKRKIRTVTSSIVASVAFVGFALAIGSGETFFMAPFGVALVGAAVARMVWGGAPLRAVAHQDGRFFLNGAAPRFVDALESKLLEDHRS